MRAAMMAEAAARRAAGEDLSSLMAPSSSAGSADVVVVPDEDSVDCTRGASSGAPASAETSAATASAAQAAAQEPIPEEPPDDLPGWLRHYRLDEYHEALVENGFEELEDLRMAEQKELDQVFDLVGVKPGHMLRFRRALRGALK